LVKDIIFFMYQLIFEAPLR